MLAGRLKVLNFILTLVKSFCPNPMAMQSSHQDYQPIQNQLETVSPNDDNTETADIGDVDQGIKEKLICGYTKKQLKVFIALVCLSLNDIMGYSAIAPFFPVVAASKGFNPMQVGLIFAAYPISGIFASLIVGVTLVKLGAKFCVLVGMFWNAGALICFGFLDQMAPTPFIVLSIAARCLMGVGSSMAYTAMFAIVFQEFGENAITTLSFSEALVGIGGTIGPLVGGALYQVGGYITPFMVLGSVQAVLLVMCWSLLPYVPVEKSAASVSPVYLIRHSSAAIAFFVIVCVFAVLGLITANMSEFLHNEFQMGPLLIGVSFLVTSICYAGMSPVWGYIADKWRNSYLMEIGLTGMAVAMALIGPATVLRSLFGWSHQQTWLMFVAAGVNGLFFGAALMPTFNEMILAARELKLKDSVLAQFGLVSGLFNTAVSLGDIIGPLAGGWLVQSITFQDACGVSAIMCITLMLLKLLQRTWRHCTRHRRSKASLVEQVEYDTGEDERRPLIE